MSTKKQIESLENQLQQSHDLIIEGLTLAKDVHAEIDDMVEADYNKAEETSGVVSQKLNAQVEMLASISEDLESTIDDIETASGEILYAFENYDL